MDGQFLLERGERAVKGVRRIGDVEFRILLIREEVREIVFERTVRAPNFLVRVVPLLLAVCILEGCLLLNERPPLSVPRIEGYVTELLKTMDMRDVRKFSRHRSLEMLMVYDDETCVEQKAQHVFNVMEKFNLAH